MINHLSLLIFLPNCEFTGKTKFFSKFWTKKTTVGYFEEHVFRLASVSVTNC